MGICDFSQERVTDDKDKRENQNEQDSEIHNIAIHITNEPNQDIRNSPLPGQERGICEITVLMNYLMIARRIKWIYQKIEMKSLVSMPLMK